MSLFLLACEPSADHSDSTSNADNAQHAEASAATSGIGAETGHTSPSAQSGAAQSGRAQSGGAQSGASSHVSQISRAKNIILFIGDGMGPSTVTAIRILDGQLKGMAGEENILAFEKFPHVALSKTYNTNQQVPDSAGTATAIMTGVKTKAGFINVGPEAYLGDCASAHGYGRASLAQRAKEQGLSVGVVSTARITHATPATVYAHVPHRNWESDARMPAEALEQGCRDIARQLVEWPHGGGLDVVMGGGRVHFLPETSSDPGVPERNGLRKDGRDLTAEWAAQDNALYIWNLEQFEALASRHASTEPLPRMLALFNPGHMEYEQNRANAANGEPSLADMTEKAIDWLAGNDEGYFLMVEAGRIDHAHHEGNAYHALHDGVALNKAVERAVSLTNPEDTLIIVTADHSHTFTIAGYPTRGNPILAKVVVNNDRGEASDDLALAKDGKPYTTLGYYAAHHAAGEGGRTDLSAIDTTADDYLQQSAVPFDSGRHGGEDVAIYAYGAGAERVHGVMEQNRIYDIMAAALFGEAPVSE